MHEEVTVKPNTRRQFMADAALLSAGAAMAAGPLAAVAGEAAKPANYLAPLGTPAVELLRLAGAGQHGLHLLVKPPVAKMAVCVDEVHRGSLRTRRGRT